jgi:tetratricopeptide (TPR) repeat protein
LERNPQDAAALETFARQIESLLKADPKLAQEMSVLIGGDVINSTVIVGEGNVAGRVDTGGGDFVRGDKVTYVQAPAATLSALHQLPPPPGDFTGRAEELAELLGKIKKGGVAISGLRGMGGIGKTALALVLADRLKAGYPDAQIYLDLKGTSEKPLTVREILEQVILSFHADLKLPEGEAQVANIYRSVLEGRRAILLMDNAAGSGQVAPLVPPSGSILLITSRNRFNVPGLFQLDIGELLEEDARDLLLKIEPRIGEQADDIAKLCGFLPLALRAAAYSAADEVAASLCADYPDAGVYLLDLRQHPREIIRWREAALAAVRRLKNRRAEGAHLGHLGLAHFWLAEYRRAVSYHEQALVIFRENGDRHAEGQCMGNLGSAYYSLGDYHRAIDHHQQDLAIAREMGDRQGEANALGNLGLACHWLAD